MFQNYLAGVCDRKQFAKLRDRWWAPEPRRRGRRVADRPVALRALGKDKLNAFVQRRAVAQNQW